MNASGVWLRRAALALVLLVLGAAVLTARMVIDGEAEMRASDAAFDRGDVAIATLHARRAAVLYAPGAPHVRPAYERLAAIATGAEAAGDRDAAKAAWGAIRATALETRHVWIPHRAELERANLNLARLETLDEPAPKDPGQAMQRALGELRRDDAPRAGWAAVLLGGFVILTIGLGLVGWRGVDPEGKIRLGQARLGVILVVVGAVFWTLAAFRA
jgi:hypothetical protein